MSCEGLLSYVATVGVGAVLVLLGMAVGFRAGRREP